MVLNRVNYLIVISYHAIKQVKKSFWDLKKISLINRSAKDIFFKLPKILNKGII